jgi:hypothetical protein
VQNLNVYGHHNSLFFVVVSPQNMSTDLLLGQLVSLAPRGKESVEVVKELANLREHPKYPKILCDFLERNNVKIKHRGSEFLISRFNCLELENGEARPYVSFYSNPMSGEVFAVDYGDIDLDIEKVFDGFESETISPLFRQVKKHILENNLKSSFQVFETENPNTVILVSGLDEYMDSNFWSIHNSCVWKLTLGANNFTLSGDVSLYTHYYENSNFHCHIPSLKVKKSHHDSLEKIFRKIRKHIGKIKLELSNKFAIMDAEFERAPGGETSGISSNQSTARFSTVTGIQPVSILKKLRRQLPVHKVKFDWNIKRVIQ